MIKIKVNNKYYSWNAKEYGNLKEHVKVYLNGKDHIFTPKEWNNIRRDNDLDTETLEIESLLTDLHGKFNKFLDLLGDFRLTPDVQKRELKKILERLTSKIQDRQLMLAMDIFIKVNYDK